MNESENFNNDQNNNMNNEELEGINYNLISDEKEEEKQEKNKDFNLNNDEITIFSPEALKDLLYKEESNDNMNKEEEKKQIENEKNIKEIEQVNDKNQIKNENNKKGKEILSFEELMERKKKNKEKINKSKDKNSKSKKSKPKIDFSGRLYQPKKNYNITENKIINNDKNKSKSREKNRPNEIKNKSNKTFKYNEFLNRKKNKSKSENKNREDNNIKIQKSKKDNSKIINDFLLRNYPRNNSEKRKKIENDNGIKHIEIKGNKKGFIKYSKSPKERNKIDFEKFKGKNMILLNEQKRSRLINKSSDISKSQSPKRKMKNNNQLKIENVPNQIVEKEIDLALKNKIIDVNMNKRYSPIKDNLIKFDNSKFEKFDTEQIRYELMKEYSNLKPNKENGFFRRMQFYSLKRKKKQERINKLLEQNKYKLSESERKKAFNRLMEDANRRINQRNEKIEEEKKNEEEEIRLYTENNNKKYNNKEWNKIYEERFKEYEEYKKKKIEIEKEKEKIEKMIEEEKSDINNKNIIIPIKIKNKRNRLYENSEIKRMNRKIDLTEGNISKNSNKSENKLINIQSNKNNEINNIYGLKRYESFKNNKKKGNITNQFKNNESIRHINKEKSGRKNKNFNNNHIKKYIVFKRSKDIDKLNFIKNSEYLVLPTEINQNKNNKIYFINDDYNKIKNETSEKENIVDDYLYNYCLNKFFI